MTAAQLMEFIDPYVREELLARIERDPGSILFYQGSACRTCLTVTAIVVAFGCGLAIGVWWSA